MSKTKAPKNSKPPKKLKAHLSGWEWETLVASWRYYEYRGTIVSATFPEDIIKRFFSGKYSREVQEQIARQFAVIDHGIRGEEDWTKDKYLHDCDKLPWTKFFRFCEGFYKGFHKIVLEIDDIHEEVDAFHVDWNDTWYSVKKYIAHPSLDYYCAPEFIVSIDGKPYKEGGVK